MKKVTRILSALLALTRCSGSDTAVTIPEGVEHIGAGTFGSFGG